MKGGAGVAVSASVWHYSGGDVLIHIGPKPGSPTTGEADLNGSCGLELMISCSKPGSSAVTNVPHGCTR